MDVSRRTLIVGGTSALVGAGVGAGAAGFVAADRTGPTLWQRADRSDAPRVGGLHLQYGADAHARADAKCPDTPRIWGPLRVFAGELTPSLAGDFGQHHSGGHGCVQ
jgi:hypothetical protein